MNMNEVSTYGKAVGGGNMRAMGDGAEVRKSAKRVGRRLAEEIVKWLALSV